MFKWDRASLIMAHLTSLLLVCVVQISSSVLAKSPHILFIVADDYGKILKKRKQIVNNSLNCFVVLYIFSNFWCFKIHFIIKGSYGDLVLTVFKSRNRTNYYL